MKNLKLGHRLIGLFMFMALLVAFTGLFGAWSIYNVGDRIQGDLMNLANQQKLILQIELSQKDSHINLLKAVMVRNDAEKFEESAEDYRMKKDLFRSQCDILLKGNKKIGILPAQKGGPIELKVNEALDSWTRFEEAAENVLTLKENLLKAAKPGAGQGASDDNLHQKTVELADANEKAKTVVDDLLVTVNKLMNEMTKEVVSTQRSAFSTFVVVIIAAIILAALLGIVITRYLVRRIDKIHRQYFQCLQAGGERRTYPGRRYQQHVIGNDTDQHFHQGGCPGCREPLPVGSREFILDSRNGGERGGSSPERGEPGPVGR
jgi:hypothetical protein